MIIKYSWRAIPRLIFLQAYFFFSGVLCCSLIRGIIQVMVSKALRYNCIKRPDLVQSRIHRWHAMWFIIGPFETKAKCYSVHADIMKSPCNFQGFNFRWTLEFNFSFPIDLNLLMLHSAKDLEILLSRNVCLETLLSGKKEIRKSMYLSRRSFQV